MKQITLTSIAVREIRFRPNDSEPSVILFYDVLDNEGNIVGEKSHHVKLTDLTNKHQTAITKYLSSLTEVLDSKELG